MPTTISPASENSSHSSLRGQKTISHVRQRNSLSPSHPGSVVDQCAPPGGPFQSTSPASLVEAANCYDATDDIQDISETIEQNIVTTLGYAVSHKGMFIAEDLSSDRTPILAPYISIAAAKSPTYIILMTCILETKQLWDRLFLQKIVASWITKLDRRRAVNDYSPFCRLLDSEASVRLPHGLYPPWWPTNVPYVTVSSLNRKGRHLNSAALQPLQLLTLKGMANLALGLVRHFKVTMPVTDNGAQWTALQKIADRNYNMLYNRSSSSNLEIT